MHKKSKLPLLMVLMLTYAVYHERAEMKPHSTLGKGNVMYGSNPGTAEAASAPASKVPMLMLNQRPVSPFLYSNSNAEMQKQPE